MTWTWPASFSQPILPVHSTINRISAKGTERPQKSPILALTQSLAVSIDLQTFAHQLPPAQHSFIHHKSPTMAGLTKATPRVTKPITLESASVYRVGKNVSQRNIYV